MFDIMTCFASEAAPLKLNDLPIGERKKIISKSVDMIETSQESQTHYSQNFLRSSYEPKFEC